MAGYGWLWLVDRSKEMMEAGPARDPRHWQESRTMQDYSV